MGLARLIELKLASGLTGGVRRMKDFTDVVALIQELALPRDFATELDQYVRAKYEELWQGIKDAPQPLWQIPTAIPRIPLRIFGPTW